MWAIASARSRLSPRKAPVAQRIEHLTTDQKVRGSNPFGRAPGIPTSGTHTGDSFIEELPVLTSLASGRIRLTRKTRY